MAKRVICDNVFVDVNKIAKVAIYYEDGKITTDVSLNDGVEKTRGAEKYIENIKKMLKVVPWQNPNKQEDRRFFVYLGQLKVGDIANYQEFGQVDVKTGQYRETNMLTATEVRLLSQGNVEKIDAVGVPTKRGKHLDGLTPKTDLHTHLSGALYPEDLRKIGQKYNVMIPLKNLKDAKIDTDKYQQYFIYTFDQEKNMEVPSGVRFNDLSEEDIDKYMTMVSIKQNAQETFMAMEDCYEYRDPFVKIKSPFFDPSIDKAEVLEMELSLAAERYIAAGVEYVEFSIAEACKDAKNYEYLENLMKVMPKIEAKYPQIKIRFLGGIPRCFGNEVFQNKANWLMAAAKCPYIVGFDAMGHESNETNDFLPSLEALIDYAINEDNDFVIRVHAGESGVSDRNIKQVLQAAKRRREFNGCTVPGVPIVRIGHGLHGMDEETIALCKELGAIIEINISSNTALDNIDALKQVPIKKYLEMGLKVVLGTDGPGMYSTDSKQEALLAQMCGLKPEHFKMIRETEEQHIARMEKNFQNKMEADANARAEFEEFSTGKKSYEQKRYSSKPLYSEDEVEAAKKAQKPLQELQCPKVKKEEPIPTIENKKPIYILGYKSKEWKALSQAEREKITTEAAKYIMSIDPSKYYFVLPSIELGFNGVVINLIKQLKPNAEIIGIVPEQALATGKVSNKFTKAKLEKGDGFKSSKKVAEHIAAEDGQVVVFGGGGIVNDHIINAHNAGCKIKIRKDAKNTKLDLLNGNNYEFDSVDEFTESYDDGLTSEQRDAKIKRVASSVLETTTQVDVNNDLEIDGGISADDR